METHSSEVDQYDEAAEKLKQEMCFKDHGEGVRLQGHETELSKRLAAPFSQAGAGFGIRIILM